MGTTSDFEVDATVNSATGNTDGNGNEMQVDITFEPSKLGEIKDMLTLVSPDGGTYLCLCTDMPRLPSRRGPLLSRPMARRRSSSRMCWPPQRSTHSLANLRPSP